MPRVQSNAPGACPGPGTFMIPEMEANVVSAGRRFYAAGIIALGLQHFYNGDFVPVIVPSFPAWLPGQYFWTCVAGTGLVITGGAILVGKAARPAAVVLGSALLAVLVFRHIPGQLPKFSSLGAWTDAFKELTLSGGAFVAAASVRDPDRPRLDRGFLDFGCFALAITVAVFGVDHFLYTAFVASLVPAWIPGHVFWTYFCGVALIAAGVGMILRIRARLASGLLGSMIFAWLIVLHIPLAIRAPYGSNGNEWTSVYEALAFSGIAFILAKLLPKRAASPT